MTQSSNRLLSLDVMRGLTIAGMIMVNNPGSWKYVYAPLRHAEWNGLTPTDLVFPFFMFIMGVSMFFSLRKYDYRLSSASLFKVLKRMVLIFLVGFAINFCSKLLYSGWEGMQSLRVLGVLQRLALAYGIGSLIGLTINHRYLLHTAAGFLLFYAALLGLTGSTELSEGNLIAVVDRALFGPAHMYSDYLPDGTKIAFDPEGLLSCLGSVGHVLIGFYAGKLIADNKGDKERIVRNLFILGTILLFAGLLLSYGFPINKKLWSSTFVLTTCGFASLLLALLMWIIDIRGCKGKAWFFESFGVNPLYLYVQADVLAIAMEYTGISAFIYMDLLRPVFGNFGGSLAFALFFVLLNWFPGYWLYKRKIYIKL